MTSPVKEITTSPVKETITSPVKETTTSSVTETMSPDSKEKINSLTSLKARALKAYATKDYPSSADLYAQACELQSDIYGEDNTQNAQLLYLYGRSLYKVAQAKSDILGAPAQEKEKAVNSAVAAVDSQAKGKSSLAAVAEVAENKTEKEKISDAKKSGLFQFTGDENWDDEDVLEEEGENEGAEGHVGADSKDVEGEEDDDEFIAAWEILDLARVFFEKQLVVHNTSEVSEEALAPQTDLKTMLADVYDLLGEVSLESELFPQAVKDLTSSLAMKKDLYPIESTLITEAEFKLALALELSAMDLSEEEGKKLFDEAAEHIKNSIASCHARIAKEEEKLAAAANSTGDNCEEPLIRTNKEIENVKGMIEELKQRLHDVENPAPKVNIDEEVDGVQGLRKLLSGGAGNLEMLQDALKSANDLTGLVRKKNPTAAEPSSNTAEGSSASASAITSVIVGEKRKLEDDDEEVSEGNTKDKKAKVEDAMDDGA
jgi:HAT1-interacting factor 1